MAPALVLATLLLPLASCSLQQRAELHAVDLLTRGWATYADEADYELARIASFSALKQIEALLASAPRDPRLLAAAGQGYGFAALAFLEDDLAILRSSGAPDGELQRAVDRLGDFYGRSRQYGLRLLEVSDSKLAGALRTRDTGNLAAGLGTASGDQVPGLFIWAFAEAGEMQFQAPGPDSIARLRRLRTVLDALLRIDPTYSHSAVRLLAGGLDCRLPVVLGGNPGRGRDQFQRIQKETDGAFLLAFVIEAETCAVITGDEEVFSTLLARVERAPSDALPGQRLLTTVAKRRAARLQQQKEMIFGKDSPS